MAGNAPTHPVALAMSKQLTVDLSRLGLQDIGTMSQTPGFSPNGTVPGPVGLNIWDAFVMAGGQQPYWQQMAGPATNQFLIHLLDLLLS